MNQDVQLTSHPFLLMEGGPLLRDGLGARDDAEESFDAADAETVATIKELIETRVRPAVANDGGDITWTGTSPCV